MNQENRGNSKTAYFGISRCGKSVTCQMITELVCQRPEIKEVVISDPQGMFTKIGTQYVDKDKDFEKYIIRREGKRPLMKLSNAMVIIDELMSFFKGGHVNQSFLDFMGLAGKHNVEVIFIGHHPRQLPPQVSINLTHLFIYNIGGSIEGFDKVENPDTALAAMTVVKEYVKQYPKGDNGYGDYPFFPYAFVDIGRNNVKFINMPEVTTKGKLVNVPYNPYSDSESDQFDKEKYGRYE